VVATGLDPRFTFDNFVVGPGNRLATAAARRVADAPGTSYNSLFIYSLSGLEKSHILNGIAHYAARVHPDFGVVYVTVESFLNELTQAVQTGSEQALRQRYEELHILLLNDVQFFTGQNEVQEMLLRLLYGMSKSGGQIVLFEASKRTGTKIMIAADRPPSGITDIDERFRTRFEMGLVVEAPGKGLPQGAGVLSLEEAPPEYMQDEDLWGGFIRPTVSDTVLPPIGGGAVLWRRALELNPDNTSLRTKIEQLGAVAAT
jgi:chromosomal replication initiator protein